MTEAPRTSIGPTPTVDLGSFPKGGIAVIFGSGGGIGSAVVAALSSTDSLRQVVGFSRKTSPPIDLQDEVSLERAATFAAETGELRLVIDATGLMRAISRAHSR